MRISDVRLLNIIKHIQTLSLAKFENQTTAQWTSVLLTDTTQQTLEIIDRMTPMKTILQNLTNNNEEMDKQINPYEEQLTQIEANFKLKKVRFLLINEREFYTNRI